MTKAIWIIAICEVIRLIAECSFLNKPYHLIDNITGTVYVVVPTSHGVAITPAYNPDGSLMTKKQLEVEG